MEFTFALISNLRKIFKKIIENCTLEDLNKIPEGFNNNIIWNIAHTFVSEQLLVYKLSGLESSVTDEMINKYRKGTKPEGDLSQLEVNEIKELLTSTLQQTMKDYNKGIFSSYNSYTVATTGNTLNSVEDALKFVAVHDGIHYGYVLALLRTLKNN